MKIYLKIFIIVILFIFNIQNIQGYNIEELDWSKSKKNYCANNVKKTLGIDTTGNAYQYKKYVDKFEKYEIGEIIVIDRYNYNYSKKGTMGYNYGHIGIITGISETYIKVFDGYYEIDIKRDIPYGSISINKIYELGFNG